MHSMHSIPADRLFTDRYAILRIKEFILTIKDDPVLLTFDEARATIESSIKGADSFTSLLTHMCHTELLFPPKVGMCAEDIGPFQMMIPLKCVRLVW